MNYKIIKNFLNSKDCENLIKEAQTKSSFQNYQKIHNNRFFLTCSNVEFSNLCNKSDNWRELEKKLASEDFFVFCWLIGLYIDWFFGIVFVIMFY